jgi:cytochrome P450
MSRSEKYFASPNDFVPERWLPKGTRPTKYDNDHLNVSNPFSIGHSNCLGKPLAYAEMRIFIARILWAFDIEEGGKNVPWPHLKTFMIIQKQPIMMKIKQREGIEDLRKEVIAF